MRLFEVDIGSARDVLAVLKGIADKQKTTSEINFSTMMNLLRPFGLGISSAAGLRALKNEIDPAGDVIKDITDKGTVILNTETPSQIKQEPTAVPGPNIDQMASSGAKKLNPDI